MYSTKSKDCRHQRYHLARAMLVKIFRDLNNMKSSEWEFCQWPLIAIIEFTNFETGSNEFWTKDFPLLVKL